MVKTSKSIWGLRALFACLLLCAVMCLGAASAYADEGEGAQADAAATVQPESSAVADEAAAVSEADAPDSAATAAEQSSAAAEQAEAAAAEPEATAEAADATADEAAIAATAEKDAAKADAASDKAVSATAQSKTGTDYDDNAYYDISWGVAKVSAETKGYISTVEGTWDRVMWSPDTKKDSEMYSDCSTLFDYICSGDGVKNWLVWYAWVDENGKWHGHIYGKPTVTNSVTGEEVEVTGWEVNLRNNSGYQYPTIDFGDWSVSGSGSLIDADTLSSAAPEQVVGVLYDSTIRSYDYGMSVRLYLADGNSVKLNKHKNTTPEDWDGALTADGKANIGNAYYDHDTDICIGNINYLFLRLGSALSNEDYHFYIEKTMSDVDDGASYTIPVQVSINGGAPTTVEIETTGNDTFSKEIVFKAYPGDYSIEISEDEASMPAGVRIVTGKATAAATTIDVEKCAGNTASIANDEPEFTVSYVVEADETYGIPGGSATPDPQTGIAYKGGVDLAAVPTTSWTTSDGTADGIPGTWTFVPGAWNTESDLSGETVSSLSGITADRVVYGKWVFEPATYTVSYDVEADGEYGMPSDAVVPGPQSGIAYKGGVDLADIPTTSWTTSDGTPDGVKGTWTFVPGAWNTESDLTGEDVTSLTGITADQIVYGKWVFTPDEEPAPVEPDPNASELKCVAAPFMAAESEGSASVKTADPVRTAVPAGMAIVALCALGLAAAVKRTKLD